MVHVALSRPARAVVPSRPYDHVYDPVYTASSGADRQTTLQKSLTSSIHRVPNWQNLFSELGTFPSCSYRLDGRQQQIQFSHVLRGGNAHKNVGTCNAAGKERYLFFNRPLIPFMQAATTGLVLSPHVLNAADQQAAEEPKTRTVAIQSMYRDESSQTVPYAPDYVYANKDNPPDIFYLKDWLPADLTRISLHEIEQLERDQARRAFQASLPPAKTDSEFHHRMKMLQEREVQDCRYKEGEVIEMEKTRLRAIMKVVEERETQFDKLTTERMEKIRAQHESDRANVIDKIQRRRHNALRKINTQRIALKQEIVTPPGRDVIKEYINYRAAVDQHGKMTDDPVHDMAQKQSETVGKTYQSLISLETSIPAKCLSFNVHKPTKVVTSLMRTRKGQTIIQDIEKINDIIQSMKSNTNNTQNGATSPIAVTDPKPSSVIRAPTPSMKSMTLQKSDPVGAACVLLQRLLRGRSVQLEMERGLRNSMTLIEELTSALAEPEMIPMTIENSANYMVDYVLGLTISKSSALLRNDVVAHEEIAKIKSLVGRATHERTRREAMQSGLRQKQFAARGKSEQKFKEVNQVLQVAASSLVNEVKKQVLIDGMRSHLSEAESPEADLNSSLGDSDVVMTCLQRRILPAVDARLQHRQEQISAAATVQAINESISTILKDL